MARVRRGVKGWRVAVLAALALLSCATVPQAEVFQLPGGVTMTIMQGCPMKLTEEELKREDSNAFAINLTSVPEPSIFHGPMLPASYIIVMEAGSYEPGPQFSCNERSLSSFITIDGAAQSSISIRPVRHWQKLAGPDAIEGYARNVQDCKDVGPRWSEIWTRNTLVRVPEAGGEQAFIGGQFGGCEYHVDQMSQAMVLTVGKSRFVVSKIVDDLFIREIKKLPTIRRN
jgi:hypothetical protein